MTNPAAPPDETPLAVRARRDLVMRPQTHRGQRFWCVKDPVALAYFHLRDEEHLVLTALDGTATAAGIGRAFSLRFGGAALPAGQLAAFLGVLIGNGLATADRPGQGERLWSRRTAGRGGRALLRRLTGLLAIRTRGIDPTRPLRLLYGLTGWLFTRPVALAAITLVALAGVMTATRFDTFVAELPDAGAFLTPANAAAFFLALGTVKVLHELGHGLACVHFGGECHELGLMLLVFTPCLYCDVSDTWLLPQKGRRIAVAAAGIVVELVLAAAATLCWWFSEPGPAHAFALNVMLICSVSTLLFNGNPLLRYDGYFVLSDLLEIPNLAAEGRAAVGRLVFGRDSGDPALTDPPEGTLLLYGLAAAAYRLLVTVGIVWLLFGLLTPLGLRPLAWLAATACTAGLVIGPVAGWTGRAFGRRRRPRRAAAVGVAVLAAVAAAVWLPLPRRVEAVAFLQPRGATRVYAAVGGRLVDALPAGTPVAAGDVIARLEDPALALDVVRLEGERAELAAALDALAGRRVGDATLGAGIPATRQALAAVTARLAARRAEAAALTVVAPTAGTLLPPPLVPERRSDATDAEPAGWHGTPLDPGNRGCAIEPGTPLGLIGNRGRLEAVFLAEEGEIEFLRPGQTARLRLDERPDRVFDAIVEAVAADPLRAVPAELTAGGLVPVRLDADGVPRPLETLYPVRLRLSDPAAAAGLRMRSAGRGKIAAGHEPPASALWRFLRRTFRFRL